MSCAYCGAGRESKPVGPRSKYYGIITWCNTRCMWKWHDQQDQLPEDERITLGRLT